MKTKVLVAIGLIAAFAMLAIVAIVPTAPPVHAQQSGDQVLLNMSWINSGVSAKGARVLQTGEVNTLSASIASATRAKLATAPASGSIYLRALLVETAATAASGSTVTLSYGTGTNCGTGTTTLLGPLAPPPVGYIRLDTLVPAGKDLCAATDAATTVARVLTN